MATFQISQTRVFDEEVMSAYRDAAMPLGRSFGSSLIFRSEQVTPLEGAFDGGRLIISSWPSTGRFYEYWNSPEYSELRALRQRASHATIWLATDER